MRAFLLCTTIGLFIVPAVGAAAGRPAPRTVCQVTRKAGKLIGQRLQVEGYVLNLGSHGYVLTGKRRDCGPGHLMLRTGHIEGSPNWRKAFTRSLGPRRAILVGTIGWEKARLTESLNPALTVERVVYLSPHEANPNDF